MKLNKADVSVESLRDKCDDCPKKATHTVQVDFRSAGTTQQIGRFCRSCAQQLAVLIRHGLPSPERPR